jgi:hypothetical protein
MKKTNLLTALPSSELRRLSCDRAFPRSAIPTLVSLLLVLLFVMEARAVSLRVDVVRGFPGNTVEVPITLSYRSNEVRNVVALQADVQFDITGILADAPDAGVLLLLHRLASSSPYSGVRRLLVYSESGASLTNGEVARIPFTVGLGEFRNFSLILSNVILVSESASEVLSTNRHGAVAVNQVYLASDGHADGFLNVAANGSEQCYVIQATTDFRSWVNIQTNSTDRALLQFFDADAGGHPARYYRAVSCEVDDGVRLGALARGANGRWQFSFAGEPGRSYVIQGSTNLIDWQNLQTTVAAGEPVVFGESLTNLPVRFFRVRTEP